MNVDENIDHCLYKSTLESIYCTNTTNYYSNIAAKLRCGERKDFLNEMNRMYIAEQDRVNTYLIEPTLSKLKTCFYDSWVSSHKDWVEEGTMEMLVNKREEGTQ